MTSRIHPADTADRPALIALWVEAWQAAMPQIDFSARRAWIAAHLERLVADGAIVLVASVADEPAGFVTVDGEGRVDQLVVALAHQRQGLARALLAAARARSPEPLRLTVNVDNPRAIRLYDRQGFRPVGRGVNPVSGLPVVHLEG